MTVASKSIPQQQQKQRTNNECLINLSQYFRELILNMTSEQKKNSQKKIKINCRKKAKVEIERF